MKTFAGQVFPAEKLRSEILQDSASLTNGTEATLLTGIAREYHDLLMVTCHNDSDVAITVSLRDKTAGTVRMIVTVPATTAQTWTFPTPLKQTSEGDNWTADRPDGGAATLSVLAQFVRNK